MKSRRASAKLLPLHLTQLPRRYSKAPQQQKDPATHLLAWAWLWLAMRSRMLLMPSL